MRERIIKFEAVSENGKMIIKGYYSFGIDIFNDQIILAQEDVPEFIRALQVIDHDPLDEYDGKNDLVSIRIVHNTYKLIGGPTHGWGRGPDKFDISCIWEDDMVQSTGIHIPYDGYKDLKAQLNDLIAVIESCK